MMLLTLTNRLQLLANKSYIMKTLSKKANFKSCQYLDGEKDELIFKYVAKETWPVGTELNRASKVMILFRFFSLSNYLMI